MDVRDMRYCLSERFLELLDEALEEASAERDLDFMLLGGVWSPDFAGLSGWTMAHDPLKREDEVQCVFGLNVALQIEADWSSPKSSSGGPVELSFIFDALKPGNLSIYLRVTEVEQNDTQPGGPVQRSIQLVENSSEPAGSDGAPALRPAVAIHEFHFEKGLGQVYRSPPLDLDGFSQESLRYDVERQREIPLAVRLFADMEAESSSTTGEGGEEEVVEDRSIHYTYVSLQKVGGLSGESPPFPGTLKLRF
ncbi:hypothetical protein AK812_SmicGene26970 [Symbiodinium microadriaticum]|uniref:Uncharacterized protein n=1 Tax=Symbiodinium microadriaticum TaxID=2951 RepID=A0A1Q9D863_SYMMI|nr:hypothetical protein AK812_SmicGene26970 [Symbiodinium microadriaticum]